MKLSETYKRIKKLISPYFGIIIIPIFIWYYIDSEKEDKEIDNYSSFTFGRISSLKGVNKQSSRKIYNYEYQFQGNKYLGSSTAYRSEVVEIGKWYKVEFSTKNPGNSRINFELEYYPILKNDSLGNIVDTIFSHEDSFNKKDLDLRMDRIRSKLKTTKTDFNFKTTHELPSLHNSTRSR